MKSLSQPSKNIIMNKSTLADKWNHLWNKKSPKIHRRSIRRSSKNIGKISKKIKDSTTSILTATFIEDIDASRNLSNKNLNFLNPKRNSDPRVMLHFNNQLTKKSFDINRKVKSPQHLFANQSQLALFSNCNDMEKPTLILYKSSKNIWKFNKDVEIANKLKREFTMGDWLMNSLKTEKIEDMKVSWESDSSISVIRRLFSPSEHLDDHKILFINYHNTLFSLYIKHFLKYFLNREE